MKKLFIHIPKNSGMTIRRSDVLKPFVVPVSKDKLISKKYTDGLLAKMKQTNDHHGIEHARWKDIKPAITSLHGCFAIIRNPWSRVVSRYFFAIQVIEDQKKVDPSYANISSFEAFLDERYKWENEEYMWHRAVRGWFPAFDHVSDENEKVQCDILRLEHLNEDVKSYFNISEMSRPRNVTSTKKKKPYQEIYTPKTIQIVADWYKKDIEYWGFDFDTSATKNYWNKI